MDYKFCLTPRLISLAIFAGAALMVLLFALGYQIGQSTSREQALGVDSALAGAVGAAGDRSGQRLEKRVDQGLQSGAAAAASATAPFTAPVRAATKALQ